MSAVTDDERERAAEGLRHVLDDIEQGRLEASSAQQAYIAGALQALIQG
jgi:hypothetical protein